MKFCISNKLTGDANAAGPWITLLSSKVVRHKATITHMCTQALSLINPALKKNFFSAHKQHSVLLPKFLSNTKTK